mmetsp:Transcript_108290/g.305284  ORF Transcript_108290/g.305284 Transcript_108290/m.305284 type:complete len:203 (+) Transcript_108290:1714-2322(+)
MSEQQNERREGHELLKEQYGYSQNDPEAERRLNAQAADTTVLHVRVLKGVAGRKRPDARVWLQIRAASNHRPHAYARIFANHNGAHCEAAHWTQSERTQDATIEADVVLDGQQIGFGNLRVCGNAHTCSDRGAQETVIQSQVVVEDAAPQDVLRRVDDPPPCVHPTEERVLTFAIPPHHDPLQEDGEGWPHDAHKQPAQCST